MKRLFKFVLVATLGLVFSLGVQVLFQVTAQQPIPTQESALALVQTGKQHYNAGKFSDAAGYQFKPGQYANFALGTSEIFGAVCFGA